jgi:hypothetical protein
MSSPSVNNTTGTGSQGEATVKFLRLDGSVLGTMQISNPPTAEDRRRFGLGAMVMAATELHELIGTGSTSPSENDRRT